ncbi:MAG TPA: hypothetical protein DCX89_06520, partial [Saprospirales bacterium]|nr:hypothetical protein [Saprospirales bacterium]
PILKSGFKTNDEEVETLINEQEKYFNSSLREKGNLIIPALGRIYLDDRQKVKFEADIELQKCLEFAYPDLPLNYYQPQQYLQKIQQEASIQRAVSSDPLESSKKAVIPWYVYLTGIILAAFLLSLGISYFAGFKPFTGSSESDHKTIEASTEPPNYDSTNIFEEEPVISDTQEMQMPLKEISPETEQPEINSTIEAKKKVTVPKTDEAKPSHEEINRIIELSQQNKSQISNPLIIIVGSFKMPDEVKKMLHSIESGGYQGFVIKYEEYYRTGILMDHPATQTDSVLNDIKEKIEKDAWILAD